MQTANISTVCGYAMQVRMRAAVVMELLWRWPEISLENWLLGTIVWKVCGGTVSLTAMSFEKGYM